ncbi:MAG TPA: DUF4157 domain-containing protein [Thermoanaerobaculia bacterium]|nr:DUF4157 domain-containing protein [Thermoanaerobaculia bacterium]
MAHERSTESSGDLLPPRPAPLSRGEPSADGGRPLEPGLRASFESRLGGSFSRLGPAPAGQLAVDPGGGHLEREAEAAGTRAAAGGAGGARQDFSRVRVHAGADAAREADQLGARAFTVGSNVYFGAGQYAPGTPAGDRLLGHELAHVVQQGGNPGAIQREKKKPGGESEGTWVPDEDGDLYYKTQKEAERRLEKLQEREPEGKFRVRSFERKGETFWRVEQLVKDKEKPKAPPEKPPEKKPPEGKPPKEEKPPPKEKEPPPKEPPGKVTEEKPKGGAGTKTPTKVGVGAGVTRTFALTFDDGPHVAALGKGTNLTENVLDTLKAKSIKGGFFVQTGVSFRGAHPTGQKLIERMAKEGHKVGVHTGGTKDHELHTEAEKAGRLEGELNAGKAAIKTATGADPGFVRPPTGAKATNAAVLATYKKVGLTNLLWDIDVDQGADLPLATLKARIRSEMIAVRNRGWTLTTPSSKIVVLMHDIQKGTSNNLPDLIDHIKATLEDITLDPDTKKKDTAAFAPP